MFPARGSALQNSVSRMNACAYDCVSRFHSLDPAIKPWQISLFRKHTHQVLRVQSIHSHKTVTTVHDRVRSWRDALRDCCMKKRTFLLKNSLKPGWDVVLLKLLGLTVARQTYGSYSDIVPKSYQIPHLPSPRSSVNLPAPVYVGSR